MTRRPNGPRAGVHVRAGAAVEDRLRRLADNLPTYGSVILTRADLEELLQPFGARVVEVEPGQADLTVAQVAARLNRTPQTVRDWIGAGQLGAYKFNGREWRITPTALTEFEDRRRNGGFKRDLVSDPPRLSAWRDG